MKTGILLTVLALFSAPVASFRAPHCRKWSRPACSGSACTVKCVAAFADPNNPTYYSRWLTSLTFADGGWGDVYCPDGYSKDPTNLNEGTGKSDYIYTCFRQGEDITPINDIVVITGMAADTADCPTGYTFLDYDLNDSAGGKYIYYCISRGGAKPINAIAYKVLDKELKDSSYPNGTCRLQDLNDMAGGKYIYLCFSKDQDVIKEVVLTDITYDLSSIPENDTHLVAVATIRFNNTSDVEAAPDSITDSYTYTTSQYWGTSIASGVSMRIFGGVPVFNGDWGVSRMETHATTSGSAIVMVHQQTYTLNCGAPPNSAMECSAAYTQGEIAVPYNATQTVYYVDGRAPVVSEIRDAYQGVSVSSLEIVNTVVGNFTEA